MPDLRAAIQREKLDSRFILHALDKGRPSMVEQLQVLVHTDPAEAIWHRHRGKRSSAGGGGGL